jgi:histidinol-phosphatase (PHP family)
LFDYHVHTTYSSDGRMTMETLCKQAIKLGLKEIAITDHIDMDWPVPGYTSFDIETLKQYLSDIEKMKKKFKGQLIIKKGIEIGLQPHILDQCTNVIREYPFDFIIASIHIVDRTDPYLGDFYNNKTKEESYRRYYEEVLALIESYDAFNVLGHLDYIKRYSPFLVEEGDHLLCRSIVDDILKTLIRKEKGLEVNTSGYRHASKTTMPHPDIIHRYWKLGGRIITLGSDAHSPEYLGLGFDAALKEIKKAGFTALTTFTNQKPYFSPIP